MKKLRHGSLFSGIGGFDLAAEWMGWENVFHCEWNEFGQRVLKYYWPKAKSHNDIKKTDFNIYRGRIDIISGGFPCQPYSNAGKRLGKEDDRHLWPEMLRAIREIQPTWVVGENVLGLVNWNGGLVFDEVQSDLEAKGYSVQPYVLPACAVNAPHRRDRVWFIAYSNGAKPSDNERENPKKKGNLRRGKTSDVSGELPSIGDATDTISREREVGRKLNGMGRVREQDEGDRWSEFPTQPPFCTGNDGLSSELDGITFSKWRQESIKGGGNAIVPQVAHQIFKAVAEYSK